MTLYSLKSSPTGYQVFKLDDDFEHLATYDLTYDENRRLQCSCPAGIRPKCRHREMFGVFHFNDRIDSGWLYNYENELWLEPKNPINPEPPSTTIKRRF